VFKRRIMIIERKDKEKKHTVFVCLFEVWVLVVVVHEVSKFKVVPTGLCSPFVYVCNPPFQPLSRWHVEHGRNNTPNDFDSNSMEPIETWVRHITGTHCPPMFLPINAATTVELRGDCYLHGWMQHGFESEKCTLLSSSLLY